jgi:hypothetical protein
MLRFSDREKGDAVSESGVRVVHASAEREDFA